MNQKQPAESPTPEELAKALNDIGYATLQSCLAHQLYHVEVVPLLRKNGVSEDRIKIVNNASLESQLRFLRKLNEFFKPLPKKEKKENPLQEDDLRAEHYTGFQSPGCFLCSTDQTEINRRVGHITLKQVRHKEKNCTELIQGSLPIAVDRLLTFFVFLRDKYPSLSSPMQDEVHFYIERLEWLKKFFSQSGP